MKKAYVVGGIVTVVLAAVVVAALFLPSYFARRGIDDLIATLPPGTSFTYQKAGYSLLKRELVLSGGVIHATDPAIDVDIAELVVQDGNADLQTAVDKARANPDPANDTVTKIAGKLIAHGVHGTYKALDATIDQIEIDNARLYLGELFAPLPPLKPETDISMFRGLPNVAALRDMLQGNARSYLAIAYDMTKLQNLEVRGTVPFINQSACFHLGAIQSDGFDRGKVAAGSLQDINFQIATVSLSVASWNFGALDQHAFYVALRDGEPMETAFGQISNSHSQSLNNIVVKHNDAALFTIEQIGMLLNSYQDGIPSFDMTLSKLTLDNSAAAPNPAAANMTQLGYSPAVFDAKFSDKWDVASQRLTVSDTSLTLENGGTLSFYGIFSDLQRGIPPVGTMPTTKVVGMTLRYDDDSLATRIITQMAKGKNVTVDVMKQSYISALQAQQSVLAAQSPVMASGMPALEAFIANPHQLTMTINPPTPVGMADLDRANPQAFIDKLGLAITAQ